MGELRLKHLFGRTGSKDLKLLCRSQVDRNASYRQNGFAAVENLQMLISIKEEILTDKRYGSLRLTSALKHVDLDGGRRSYIKTVRVLLTMLLLTATIGSFGCSSQQETRSTETTTTTYPVQDNQTAQSNQSAQTTQTTTTTEKSGHSSLLGATANLVWTAVTLPFRVVGDVLGEIV
jgi:hypothetical protein